MSDPEKKFRRLAKLVSREVSGEFFVADNVLGKIHSLGPLGSAIWRLLDKPHSREECVQVFKAAFPNEGEERVKELVNGTIAGLETNGLVYRA